MIKDFTAGRCVPSESWEDSILGLGIYIITQGMIQLRKAYLRDQNAIMAWANTQIIVTSFALEEFSLPTSVARGHGH